jgi:HEAT repeat protein
VAVSLLRVIPDHGQAKTYLRQTAVFGDIPSREIALTALGEWGDTEAFDFLVNELKDRSLPPTIRSVILFSLARIDALKALPHLIESLGEADDPVLETTAQLLGEIGEPALEPVLAALPHAERSVGALLALERLPMPPSKPILDFARAEVSRAEEYDALMRGVSSQRKNEAMSLLSDALHKRSHAHGIRALRAVGLLGDRSAMNTAIENLQAPDLSQRANVIEALESISSKWRGILQPLMKLWEDEGGGEMPVDWERLLNDEDEWVRECAAFARHFGETDMDTLATLSLMDRILFLRRVPLFSTLSPADLKQVAAIASEEVFPDGEVIAEEGEQGDAMFVIIAGEVRVCLNGVEVARRATGEYVGELSVLNREPRIATLIASGDVRTLCIDHKNFEGLIRERPDVSLFIIQVLSQRLKEATEQKSIAPR